MLHVASVCTPCCMLFHPFAHHCNRDATTRNIVGATKCGLSYVQMNVTTPKFFSPTMLGVVASVCTWITFGRFQTLRNNYQQHATTYNNMHKVCKGTKHVASKNVWSCWPTTLRRLHGDLRCKYNGYLPQSTARILQTSLLN